jgi:lipoate-protein ligase A
MRRGGAILQHGAMPLDGDTGEICSLLAMAPAARKAAASQLRRRAITLAEAAGRQVRFGEAAAALREACSGTWGVRLDARELSAAEWSAAAVLRQDRYRDLAKDR